MRRADRLFQTVQLIRGRRLCTAAWLAQRLQVSLRTVYRDVADLAAQGVPIDGEAGVGYRMAQALVAAVRLAQPRLDASLAAQAEAALGKVLAVLPPATRVAAEALALYAPDLGTDAATRERLLQLREAIASRRLLHIRYLDLKDVPSSRTLRPLGCFNWGQVWTLAAWCETRADFRSFRLDRISALQVLDTPFRDEPGRTLADLQRRVRAD